MSLSLAAEPKAHDGPSVLCLRRQGMRLPTQPMPRRQGIWLPTRPGRGHEGRECGFRPARAEATKAGKAASDRAPTHELGSTRLLPHRGSRAAKGPEGATNHFLKFRDTSRSTVSQYEAFRGEIRRVDLAKKVAKNNENRYLANPRSIKFSVRPFLSVIFSLHSQNVV